MNKKRKPRHELSKTDLSKGGRGHARKVRKRRDKQIAGHVQWLTELSALTDMRWRPALQTLARVTILMERAYEVLPTARTY
ncbi:MAG: hypothetical protein ACLQDV_02945 [Candidatus Binataceae bacterium]